MRSGREGITIRDPVRVVWPESGRVELETFELGRPGEGEVIIESEYTLISPGTELAWLHHLPNTPDEYPQYPGYNHVGIVTELGANVTGVSVGDRVVSGANHASMARIPATRVMKVPEGLAPEEAVYVNMACISMQAVRKAEVELGEVVLVMGQGIIGNMALQLARLSGALPVVGTDLIEERLELSRACGADLAVNPQAEDLKARLRDLIGRDAVDVVLDATGVPQAVPQCLDLADYRGRVVLLASTRGVTERVNFYRDVHRDGVIIIGAHNRVRPRAESTHSYWTTDDDRGVALRFMAAGRLRGALLTTDLLEYEDAPRGYEFLSEDRAQHLGVVFDWR